MALFKCMNGPYEGEEIDLDGDRTLDFKVRAKGCHWHGFYKAYRGYADTPLKVAHWISCSGD